MVMGIYLRTKETAQPNGIGRLEVDQPGIEVLVTALQIGDPGRKTQQRRISQSSPVIRNLILKMSASADQIFMTPNKPNLAG